MAFIETTPPAEATGEVRQMYERQQAHYGYVPNYAKVFCHRPEVMRRWAELLAGIRRPLDERRFELVTTAAAQALHSTYCSLAHGRALTEFLSAEDVRSMLLGARPEALSEADLAMVHLARKVARDASSVTRSDVEALRDCGFTDAEIFDVVATAAARAFFSKVVEGLGAAADATFLDMEAPLRESLTVGRPIDTLEPERLPGESP